MFKWIKKEVLIALPAIIYFFLAINLFNMTFGWLLKEAGTQLITFPRIVIISIIIGKIMLIADALPFLNKFSDRPLIYIIFWKTGIYSLCGFTFLMIERMASLFLKYKDMDIAWQHMPHNTSWPRFCTGQIWMVVLFLLFVTFREFVKDVGKDKVRKMLIGR